MILLEFVDEAQDECHVEDVTLPEDPHPVVGLWTMNTGTVFLLTPALARRVAQALTEWADKEEGR
jgi:hypothetical protein